MSSATVLCIVYSRVAKLIDVLSRNSPPVAYAPDCKLLSRLMLSFSRFLYFLFSAKLLMTGNLEVFFPAVGGLAFLLLDPIIE